MQGSLETPLRRNSLRDSLYRILNHENRKERNHEKERIHHPPSLTAVAKALARQEAMAWQAESTEVF
jgi:hypothetical protein